VEDLLEEMRAGGLNPYKIMEMAKRVDPDELAEATGVPVEKLYRPPAKEGEEPRLNVNMALFRLMLNRNRGH